MSRIVFDKTILNEEIKKLDSILENQKQSKKSLLNYLEKISEYISTSSDGEITTRLVSSLSNVQKIFDNIKENTANSLELRLFLENLSNSGPINNIDFEKYHTQYINLENNILLTNASYISFIEETSNLLKLDISDFNYKIFETPKIKNSIESIAETAIIIDSPSDTENLEQSNNATNSDTTIFLDDAIIEVPPVTAEEEIKIVSYIEKTISETEPVFEDSIVENETIVDEPLPETTVIEIAPINEEIIPETEPVFEDSIIENEIIIEESSTEKETEIKELIIENKTNEEIITDENIEEIKVVAEEKVETTKTATDEYVEAIIEQDIEENIEENIEEIKLIVEEIETITEVTEENLDNTMFNEKTLFIYNETQTAILPYYLTDLEEYFSENPEKYSSINDIVDQEYTVSLIEYENSSIKRFKEAFNLAKNKCNLSFVEAINFSNKFLFEINVEPIIIASCNSIDELNDYLDCVDNNTLDKFNHFKIIEN